MRGNKLAAVRLLVHKRIFCGKERSSLLKKIRWWEENILDLRGQNSKICASRVHDIYVAKPKHYQASCGSESQLRRHLAFRLKIPCHICITLPDGVQKLHSIRSLTCLYLLFMTTLAKVEADESFIMTINM